VKKRAAAQSAQRAALIKRQIELVAGIPLTPPRLYIGPTRTAVLRADPTKYTAEPIRLCQHGHPRKWCVVCAERRGQ
jgi:hypothetical protein